MFGDIPETETQWILGGQPVMKRETPTIMSGRVIRYRLGRYGGEVSASRDGVLIHGELPMLRRSNDLEILQEVIASAWEDAKRLSRDDRYALHLN